MNFKKIPKEVVNTSNKLHSTIRAALDLGQRRNGDVVGK